MKAPRLFLVLLALSAGAVSSPAADGEDPLAGPGPVLVPGGNDASWREFFARIAGAGAVQAEFREERHFPFRREPTVVDGEMRLDPARGLSLHYAEGGGRTMIVDEAGVRLRDARGRTRALPPDPRAPALGAVLWPVLRFDLVELARTFELHAARAGADWRLDLLPRDRELAHSLGAITVRGAGERVREIDVVRGPQQRIRIVIGAAQTGVTFPPEDVQRYFR